ncbi:uncharacterized protein LOC6590595 isoform X3 [Drosophila persimilis]|uniref:uncharacterized protein LOC6590595 isoform X3 n=1 Tax=Drosophila persimilis TaxID=7234 RepID=UPI000F07CAC8|nr:uncharacterized protein LOC6590595 isoform X3 [Drosophila persimilis]
MYRSSRLLRYILCVISGICAVGGCLLIWYGAWLLESLADEQSVVVLDHGEDLAAVLCILLGSVIILASIFGCVAMGRDSRTMLILCGSVGSALGGSVRDVQHQLCSQQGHTAGQPASRLRRSVGSSACGEQHPEHLRALAALLWSQQCRGLYASGQGAASELLPRSGLHKALESVYGRLRD